MQKLRDGGGALDATKARATIQRDAYMKTMSQVTMRKMASEPAQCMILMSPATRGTSKARETNNPASNGRGQFSGARTTKTGSALQHVHSPLTWSLAKVAAEARVVSYRPMAAEILLECAPRVILLLETDTGVSSLITNQRNGVPPETRATHKPCRSSRTKLR